MTTLDSRRLLCALSLLASPSAAQLTFTDATAASGLVHTHTPLVDQPGLMLAGGATPGDFDRDGWVDLFVPSDGNQADRLFMNQADGTFVDEAAAWQLNELYRGVGCNAADYDSDGWLDIYVTSMGDVPTSPQNGMHRLYHNETGKSFANVAEAAGVNNTQQVSNQPDGMGVCWGDYDLDSDLDLWVAGLFFTGSSTSETAGTRLFRNEGDGTFTDVSVSSEMFTDTIRGFGALFVDIDGDRYPELCAAGDFGTSSYFKNDADGTFTKMAWYLPGGDKVHNGMGTTLADFDRDGDPDWFVTAIWPAWFFSGPDGNRLYMNDGNGSHHFSTSAPEVGVDDGGWGWGAAANDFDHNGLADIVHTNGWPYVDFVTGYDFTADPTRLFLQNDGGGVFTDNAASAGITHTGQGRGLVTWDPDRDGDMDVLIVTNRGAMQYFRNEVSGPQTNWLSVRLDSSGNPALAPDGLGSKVQVFATEEVFQTAWLTGGSNYLSRSEYLMHFGVKGLSAVERVEVSWADGFKTVLADVSSNQEVVVSAQLPYSHTPLIGGSIADFEIAGIEDGEAAVLLYSLDTNLGNGACFPGLGNLCIDLASPALLGTAIADASGTASLSMPIPTGLAGLSIASQAVVPRGPAWMHSLKTNALVSTLQ